MSDILTIPYENKTLGAKVFVRIPANLEELQKAFPAEDIHHGAVKHAFYQPWNTAFRKAVAIKLEETTGNKRKQKFVAGVPQVTTKKDGTETPILESELDYVKRLKLENAISEADYLALCQTVADTVEFKLAKAEEEAEPDESFIRLAKQVLAMVEAGTISKKTGEPITEDSFVSNWESLNPGHSFEALGGFTETGIARALEIDDRRKKQEVPADLI